MPFVEPAIVASRCGSYRSLFDRRSGLLARYSDREWTPGPELLEINLVGPRGQLFELGSLRSLLDQAPLCCQVLLTGNPEAHPALASILRTIRDRGVIPSVVVEGPRPRSDVVEALRRFAGFVALDCAFDRRRVDMAKELRALGLKVQLHIPVADATVEWLTAMLTREAVHQFAGLVVLTGRSASGPTSQPAGLSVGEPVEELLDVLRRRHPFRLAIDGRLSPLVLARGMGHADTLARCEAGRSGVFVRHDLKVTPCSLLPDEVVGDLGEQDLARIWRGPELTNFRRDAALRAGRPACGELAPSPGGEREAPRTGPGAMDLRIGYATSSLCDRAFVPLARSQIVQVLAAIRDWKALRFFNDDHKAAQVAASWTSLEYFLSLPPLWGQDLARLHEQLVAGTFEGRELRAD